jgi:arylsulfatase A-like enzyme
MFTGLYPHTHGNRRRAGLDSEQLTMAEILRAAGFRTGGFVSGFTLKSGPSSLDRGFEVYDDRFGDMRRDGDSSTDLALEWVRSLQPDERYFLFLHTYDAHGRYRESEYIDQFRSAKKGRRIGGIPMYQRVRRDDKLVRNLNEYVDRYDSQIRVEDAMIERLLSELPTENTLVVVHADHGETFAERSFGHTLNHGGNLFQEQIAVPLLFHGPGVVAQRLDQLAGSVDLLPTVTDLLGVELPEGLGVQGQNWADCLRGEPCGRGRGLAFSQGSTRPRAWGKAGRDYDHGQWMEAVQTDRWKLIWYPGKEADHRELYDLVNDPEETTDVADQQPEIVAGLEKIRLEWRAGGDRAGAAPQDADEDLESLRALGYVD